MTIFHSWRNTPRRVKKWLVYTGVRHFCPLCRRFLRTFVPVGAPPGQGVINRLQIVAMGKRTQYGCPWCGASDKERLVYSYFERKTEIFSETPLALLHIAPERNTMRVLRARKNIKYMAGTKIEGDPRYADGRYEDALDLDVTQLPFPEASFDVVICNHVLEHVLEDTTAMREIYRVLKPGGFAILQVPVTRVQQQSIENPSATSRDDRVRMFGQVDHVRIYAEEDYLARLRTAGFRVEVVSPKDILSPFEIRRNGINETENVYIGRKRE